MGTEVQQPAQRLGRRPRDVTLACLAIAIAVLGCFGYFGAVCAGGMIGDHDWVGIHFYDGRLRGFWIHSTDAPVAVEHQADRTRFSINGAEPVFVGPPLVPVRAELGSIPRRSWIRIGNRRAVPPFGGAWRATIWWFNPGARPTPSALRTTYFRIPFVLPVVLLMIIPVHASVGVVHYRHRYRSRYRKNQCVNCGYDLRGTPSTRCPECGAIAPLTCRFCGYDLRGATSQLCPECGRPGRLPQAGTPPPLSLD